eukprot:CAMPEP_0181232732 /NCGR_PEP_ID=MMETSP1096-20121128/35913_1 /TAXON_ID=156174 ORGANISM="Chrysochromulina ericina, Strain CCMP281" /NCGR_SAMPLE_ID=MMETSP1096 /ASSEMBLY_ACC=CAM_ASM_000453 /LENGTH=124 /DNA_ID=CAMNT_0023327093 /DNA_START=20 /DNA_END=394 /DNA_ORIENTATION=+
MHKRQVSSGEVSEVAQSSAQQEQPAKTRSHPEQVRELTSDALEEILRQAAWPYLPLFDKILERPPLLVNQWWRHSRCDRALLTLWPQRTTLAFVAFRRGIHQRSVASGATMFARLKETPRLSRR